MKFLLELVACWRAEEMRSVALPLPPREPPPRLDCSRYDSRKRGRAAAAVSRSKSASEWRPSLCSISEDNVVPERGGQPTLAGSERMLKRTVASTATATATAAGAHVRNYSDDFGRSGFPTVIPAFSPTFLF